tara:strand:- start:104 stop:667 length:564 start_codon:yes stop_codon:yes gene_type:complete
MKFILASQSPRRKEILKKMNLDFEVLNAKIDESIISKNIEPHKYSMKLAELKSEGISNRNPDKTVIGADTIVSIDDQILNKPRNIDESRQMLHLLSNRTHDVITGVSLKNKFLNIDENFYDLTLVTFYKLSDREINYYIDFYKPFDKAGSYGIQDYGSLFIKEIKGSYDNVVGFPVSKFYQILKQYI